MLAAVLLQINVAGPGRRILLLDIHRRRSAGAQVLTRCSGRRGSWVAPGRSAGPGKLHRRPVSRRVQGGRI